MLKLIIEKVKRISGEDFDTVGLERHLSDVLNFCIKKKKKVAA
jgi:hypothetical protein